MYIHRKKCEKHCSTYHLKRLETPILYGFKEKRKHKNNEKRKRRIKVFEGQQDCEK